MSADDGQSAHPPQSFEPARDNAPWLLMWEDSEGEECGDHEVMPLPLRMLHHQEAAGTIVWNSATLSYVKAQEAPDSAAVTGEVKNPASAPEREADRLRLARPPYAGLDRFFALLLPARLHRGVIRPTLADIRHEVLDAEYRGDKLLARVAWARGWFVLLWTLLNLLLPVASIAAAVVRILRGG